MATEAALAGRFRTVHYAALAGGSHAEHWITALDLLGRLHHFKVTTYLKMGCPLTTEQQPLVMGDNRPNSEDSRFHGDLPSKGFVAKQFIVGRAVVISWPTSHWTWLDNFSNVFKDVPKP